MEKSRKVVYNISAIIRTSKLISNMQSTTVTTDVCDLERNKAVIFSMDCLLSYNDINITLEILPIQTNNDVNGFKFIPVLVLHKNCNKTLH